MLMYRYEYKYSKVRSLLFKIIAFALFITTSNSHAKSLDSLQLQEKTVGFSSPLESKLLGQKVGLDIYLPENYDEKNDSYPVMYMLDSDKYFLQAVAYQKALVFQNKTPEFIVVGITLPPKNRRDLLGKKRAILVEFVKGELQPYVNQNYRTKGLDLYFGWEMAGGFALDLLSEEESLFDGYFLASSTHFVEQRLDSVESRLQKRDNLSEVFIYFAVGSVESWALESHQTLANILNRNNIPSSTWHYNKSKKHDHYTTPFSAINDGLNMYFFDYAPKRFYSLKEFEEFGGLPALKAHYKRRGERFQVSTAIHDDTQHYLLNQAVNENNYQAFITLDKSFNGLMTRHYDRAFWFIKYSGIHVKNSRYKRAIETLDLGLKTIGVSAEIYEAKGDIYLLQKDIEQAKVNYHKAIEISSKSGNKDQLEKYRNKLRDVEVINKSE